MGRGGGGVEEDGTLSTTLTSYHITATVTTMDKDDYDCEGGRVGREGVRNIHPQIFQEIG